MGDSHIFCRHGLRRWWSRIWRTIPAAIGFTTPSRTSWWASSVQPYCDNDRPTSFGRFQAIPTGRPRPAAARR
ncbi:MAG: hypothetical protein JOZ53_14055 [Planctomycetaceae bacterium]|nr:hypothetical protein [Planctomycetaceae bacterium]